LYLGGEVLRGTWKTTRTKTKTNCEIKPELERHTRTESQKIKEHGPLGDQSFHVFEQSV